MELRKLIFSVITIIVFVVLCTQIKAEFKVVGEEIDYDRTWEQTSEKFPILNEMPRFADKIDYWRTQTLSPIAGFTGVNLHFQEVKNPEQMADSIAKKLLDDGFEFIEEENNADDHEPYQAVKYKKTYRKNFWDRNFRIEARIEYFEYKYPFSHNVSVLIFVRTPK